jgi:predicted DCC family thiol-disulfide oxidoreductase YuxK
MKTRIQDAAIYPMTIHFDGDCAICRFDVAHLRRRDRGGRLCFIDIAAPAFDAVALARRYGLPEAGIEATLRARLHAVLADGTLIVGVEVFRHAYSAAGFGSLVALTRWPGLRALSEFAYALFARHRVMLSRRFGGLFAALTPADCDSSSCRIN